MAKEEILSIIVEENVVTKLEFLEKRFEREATDITNLEIEIDTMKSNNYCLYKEC